MLENDIVPAFQRPIEPQDAWTVEQYKKYGFIQTPSLEEVEAKATELLSSPLTALAGAELVLGRRVSGNLKKEPEVIPLVFTPGFSGPQRFALLIMQKEIEAAKAREAKK